MAAEHVANPSQPDRDQLSERDAAILDFERQWWKYAGAKEQAIREKFDMSSARYYQVLNALIDRPEALEVEDRRVALGQLVAIRLARVGNVLGGHARRLLRAGEVGVAVEQSR